MEEKIKHFALSGTIHKGGRAPIFELREAQALRIRNNNHIHKLVNNT